MSCAGIAAVAEACRHPPDQPDRPVGLAQQHRPGIRRHRSAVERRHHTATIEPFEFELPRYTLSASDAAPELINPLSQKDDLDTPGADAPASVRYPGSHVRNETKAN